MWVQIPCLPLISPLPPGGREAGGEGDILPPFPACEKWAGGKGCAPMVKWTSSLASNEEFRVRVLVGVLEKWSVASGKSSLVSD